MGLLSDNTRFFIFIHCLISVLQLVSGNGMLQIQLVSYVNPHGLLMDGNDCDNDETECDTWMEFCIRQSPYHINSTCRYGNESTGILGGDAIDFTSGQFLGNGLTNPIAFPFTDEWPSQFGLFVRVFDDDTTGDELIDEYYKTIQIEPGKTEQSALWRTELMLGENTQIETQVKVFCEADWYDRHCNTYCKAEPEDTYTCEYSTGTIVCKLGWVGPDCDMALCATGCHPIHGSCTQPRECICEEYWTGRRCDQCIPKAGCANGFCTVGNDCICNDDTWAGELCNIDLDSCRSNPCLNEAHCESTGPDAYNCQCTTGFTGINCETEINECDSSPCQNGGTCIDGPGIYECNCGLSYEGVNCESEINHCLVPGVGGEMVPSGACGDHGTCISEPTVFICECHTGFTGRYCKTNIDDCVVNECKHGSTCVDDINAYHCDCLPGWEGHHCQRDIDECSSMPCKNGGTCTDLLADFECACPKGWEGKDCTARAPDDCFVMKKGIISHGAEWEDDCNGCLCDDGNIKCSKIWCGPDNCLNLNPDIDETNDHVINTCSPEAPCSLVSDIECLQGVCEDFGKCINENDPAPKDAKCGESFFEEKATTYACTYVGMRLDFNILPMNTTVEQVCDALRDIQDLRPHAMEDRLIIQCDKDLESGEDNVIYVSQESGGGMEVTKEAMDEMIGYIRSLPEDSDNLILKSIYIFSPKKSEKSTGSAIGIWLPILLAILALLILIAVIAFVIWYRRRKQREDKHVDHPLSRLTLKMRENPFFEEKDEVEDYNCTTYVQTPDNCSSSPDADYELDVISIHSQSDAGCQGGGSEGEAGDADYVAMDDKEPKPETSTIDGSPDNV